MNDVLLWIVLIVSLLVLIAILVVIFLLAKKKETVKTDPTYLKEIGALENELTQLKADLDSAIDKSVQAEVSKLLLAQGENNEKSRARLDQFAADMTKDITDRFANVNETIEKRLDQIQCNVDQRLKSGFELNSQYLDKVSASLGKITEAQRNLDSLNTQVTDLNGILSNSQKRGRFGEITLAAILNQVFGSTHDIYDTQYVMKTLDGREVKPDAVVKMPAPINTLCIDAKFSFVAYRALFDHEGDEEALTIAKKDMAKAMRNQVDKIAQDYIQKNVTAPYALMFIPSDGIYASIQSDDYLYSQVVQYAQSKSVIITSPATLQPILANLGLLNANINTRKNIDVIIKQITIFKKEVEAMEKNWASVSLTVDKLYKDKDLFSSSVHRLANKADSISGYLPEENKDDQGGEKGN